MHGNAMDRHAVSFDVFDMLVKKRACKPCIILGEVHGLFDYSEHCVCHTYYNYCRHFSGYNFGLMAFD